MFTLKPYFDCISVRSRFHVSFLVAYESIAFSFIFHDIKHMAYAHFVLDMLSPTIPVTVWDDSTSLVMKCENIRVM